MSTDDVGERAFECVAVELALNANRECAVVRRDVRRQPVDEQHLLLRIRRREGGHDGRLIDDLRRLLRAAGSDCRLDALGERR